MKISLFAVAAAPLILAGAVCAQDAPPPPGFTPSKFPGVYERHVPAPASRTTAASKTGAKHHGIRLTNIRHAPGGGMMADVDPSSFPSIKAEGRHHKRRHHHHHAR